MKSTTFQVSGDIGCNAYSYIKNGFTDMLKYYSALSKAAEGLAPILPELENLLLRKYKVNWVMFNKSLFYHYFYKKSDVKERMKKVRKVSIT